MGKLKELWAQLPQSTGLQKIEVQKKINSLESWCIQNKYAGITELTDWKTFKPRPKKTYRHEAGRDGGHNPPSGVRFGYDRCRACKYNNAAYCDPNDKEGHYAKV